MGGFISCKTNINSSTKERENINEIQKSNVNSNQNDTLYYSNGKIKSIVFDIDSVDSEKNIYKKEFLLFYKNGKLKEKYFQGEYNASGCYVGVHQKFNFHGQLILKIIYHNNSFEKAYIEYDYYHNGQLVLIEKYTNDTLYEIEKKLISSKKIISNHSLFNHIDFGNLSGDKLVSDSIFVSEIISKCSLSLDSCKLDRIKTNYFKLFEKLKPNKYILLKKEGDLSILLIKEKKESEINVKMVTFINGTKSDSLTIYSNSNIPENSVANEMIYYISETFTIWRLSLIYEENSILVDKWDRVYLDKINGEFIKG